MESKSRLPVLEDLRAFFDKFFFNESIFYVNYFEPFCQIRDKKVDLKPMITGL